MKLTISKSEISESWTLWDEHNELVGHLYFDKKEAESVVAAVNERRALLKALKRAKPIVQNFAIEGTETGDVYNEICDVLDRAKESEI